MVDFMKSTPQIPVVLASLLVWGSFAWGLPTDARVNEGDAGVAAAEDTWTCSNCDAENDAAAKYCTGCGAKRAGEAEPAAEDPWAGVRISDAYDYAKCPRCGHKNDIRAERCSGITWRVFGGNTRCAYELPQPSAEMTDPYMVFVPGKGYYPEGTLIEPARTKKGLWVTGLVLTAIPVGTGLVMGVGQALYWWQPIPAIVGCIISIPLFVMLVVGIPLLIYGLVSRTEPVYAFEGGERYDLYERPAFARRAPDSDGAAFKAEVTLLSF
jgi:hypothetical protein